MTSLNDFGFSTVDPDDKVDRATAEGYAERLEKLWDTLVPFLDNLARDPHKDIHWPDRDVKISQFKEKLRDIAFPKTVQMLGKP